MLHKISGCYVFVGQLPIDRGHKHCREETIYEYQTNKKILTSQNGKDCVFGVFMTNSYSLILEELKLF